MSNNYAFTATKRDRAGKGVARALRREGKVPAVIYGDKKEPLGIVIPANDVNVEYNRGRMFTSLCEMDVDGEKHLVLARDVQVHPVTDVVLHADFLRVTDKTTIAVRVPVNFINENKSPGLRGGGVLNIVRYKVNLICSAMNIPEAIDVDLDGTEIGDSLKISNAALPEGTRPVIDDRDFSIASVVAPKKVEEVVVESDNEEGEEGEEAAEGEAAEGGTSEGGDSAEDS